MISAALIAAHRRDLNELLRLAAVDLSLIFAAESSAVATRNQLMRVLPELVTVYGAAASSLAADWYDEVRAEAKVSGRFRAVVADLPDRGRTDALARWGVTSLFKATPDYTAARGAVQGGFERIVLDADRGTIVRSAAADPRGVGWQRQTSGSACKFCTMLAGRGAVYRAETARFTSHDNCSCTAAPVYDIDLRDGIDLRDAEPALEGATA